MLRACILDRFRKPIFYFPAIGNPNIGIANGYVASGGKPLYDWNMNNYTFSGTLTLDAMRVFLGDSGNGTAGNTARDGAITGIETARYKGPYILWSCGPDEVFGPQAGDAAPTGTLDLEDANRCDDITNFKQ